jgi:hypothetical protein
MPGSDQIPYRSEMTRWADCGSYGLYEVWMHSIVSCQITWRSNESVIHLTLRNLFLE